MSTTITDTQAEEAIRRHAGVDQAAAWRLIRRDGRVVASFPATRTTRGEFVVVAARGGGVTLAERTGDGRVHPCRCGRCPRALAVVLE